VAVQTILINFSGVYDAEGFAPQECMSLDCSSMEGVCCYCDAEALSKLRKLLTPLSSNAIHWIDSGDYHYLSLLWLEKITTPFALVLFDNHNDDQQTAFDSSLLSCGSWVNEAKKLPLLKYFYHSKGETNIVVPDGLPVYLSIDKDVLSRQYAITDWDQGEMTLDELATAVKEIAGGHTIIGVDICGELSPAKGAVDNDLKTNARTNRIIQEILLNLFH